MPTLQTTTINTIQALFSHEEPIASWIHKFKYRNQIGLSSIFTELMIEHLYLPTQIEKIIPIPIHSSRLKERGYNQTELLVNDLHKRLDIDYDMNFIIRKKSTQPQIELKHHQRQKNIKNCFQIHPLSNFSSNQILIIDDVYTTGATLNEAAQTIKQYSPQTEIHAWTIARAI